jgi:hypothetical protein
MHERHKEHEADRAVAAQRRSIRKLREGPRCEPDATPPLLISTDQFAG